MPRVGLNEDAVVDAALAVVDENDPQALTLATVAARVGVATPSLYQHVASLAQLRARVAARVLAEMTTIATDAVLGRSGDDAVATLMRRLREYAVAHPSRYAAVPAIRYTIRRWLRPRRSSCASSWRSYVGTT